MGVAEEKIGATVDVRGSFEDRTWAGNLNQAAQNAATNDRPGDSNPQQAIFLFCELRHSNW